MITEKEYTEALRIVEAYHKQIGLVSTMPKVKSLDDLVEGDFVTCIAIKAGSKGLEIGKRYEITTVSDKYHWQKYRNMWIRFSAKRQKHFMLNPSYWSA